MHLLLVEDNEGDVGLVRQALTELPAPIQISVVPDGDAASALLHRQAPYTAAPLPDLVLLDLNLPKKSGYEVLAEMRQDPTLQFIPVVVWTSTANPREVNRCYELGANAYLVKPMELEQFLGLIQVTVAFWRACKFRKLRED